MQAQKKIASVLVGRLFRAAETDADDGEPVRQSPLNRRRFLQGLGVVTAAGVALRSAYDAPSVTQIGNSIRIAYGGHEWTIEPSAYGRRARLQLFSSGSRHWLRLSRAVLPGTNLKLDLVGLIALDAARWSLKLRVPAIGLSGSVPLVQWLSGAVPLESAASLVGMRAGDALIEGRDLRASIWRDLRLVLTGPTDAIRLTGAARATGDHLMLQAGRPADDSLLNQLGIGRSGPPVTRLVLKNARLETEISLGRNGKVEKIAFASDDRLTVNAEVRNGFPARNSVFSLEGAGSLIVGTSGGRHSAQSAIALERTLVVLPGARETGEAIVAARIARRPHEIAIPGASVTIAGDDNRPLYFHFKTGVAPRLDIPVLLHQLWLPIADGDRALASFAGRPIQLVVPDDQTIAPNDARSCDEPGPRAGFVNAAFVQTADGPPDWNAWDDLTGKARGHMGLGPPPKDVLGTITIDRSPVLRLNLDGTKLNVSRGIDLLDLTYEFSGFDIHVPPQTHVPTLVRRKGSDGGFVAAKIGVIFDSQHIGETSYPDDPDDFFPSRTQARMSGKSRIGFLFKATKTPEAATDDNWAERPLTVEALTQWRGLAQNISDRALKADATYQDQIDAVHIKTDTALPAALDLIAATLQPPDTFQTALEMIGRLQLSPGPGATWITPAGQVDEKNAELWHARLDDTGRKSVRAIWSQQMVPGRFNWRTFDPSGGTLFCPGPGNGDVSDPVAMAFADRLYWEIVAQTSVYGLPALRAIPPPPPAAGAPAPPPPPPSDADPFRIFAPSRVIRPSDEYAYIQACDTKDEKGDAEFDAGIALATPFDNADIILSSMGGSLTAQWIGEPPKLRLPCKNPITLKNGGQLPVGFALERLTCLTQYGRDIEVETLEKGYLLPLGCRASYVHLTERKIKQIGNALGFFAAAPVARQFIVVQRPVKSYPGVYQPYDGREFPAKTATMITQITPDLAKPADEDRFWPQVLITQPADGPPLPSPDVDFEWTIDGVDAPITSNMFFVSNRLMTNELACGQIAQMYKATDDAAIKRRTAFLKGAHCKYAPPQTDGDTSFDTDRWLMRVRGRLLRDGGESFVMDGVMEGDDQPPFYPVMEQAHINVQSLDRMLGRQHGLITVRYDSDYIKNDFGTGSTASGIYLDIVEPCIKMDLASQGSASGGVGKPGMLVAAISRVSGLVGGTGPSNCDVPVTTTDLPDPVYNISAALGGHFNPAQFLGGAKAQLLGMVDFSALIGISDFSDAPKLLETIGYGAAGDAASTLAQLIAVFNTATDAVRSKIDALAAQLKTIAAPNDPDELYPDLTSKLKAVGDSIGKAKEAFAKAKDFEDVASPVAQTVMACKALAQSLDHVLHDPIPPLARKALGDLTDAWTGIRGELFTAYGKEKGALNQFKSSLKNDVCTAMKASLQVLLGDVNCDTLFDDPAHAALDVAVVLFAEKFGKPLTEVLKGINTLAQSAETTISGVSKVVGDIVAAASGVIPNIALLNKISQEAKAGTALWCGAVTDFVKFIRSNLPDQLPALDKPIADLENIRTAIQDIQDPFTPPDDEFEQARRRLAATAKTFIDPLNDMKTARSDLIDTLDSMTPDFCTGPDAMAKLLNQVQRVMAHKHKLAADIAKFSGDLKILDDKKAGVAKDVIAACGTLLLDLVEARLAADETQLLTSLQPLLQAVSDDLAKDIKEAVKGLAADWAAIAAHLPSAYADFVAFAKSVGDYADREWKLGVLVLQTVIPFAAGLVTDANAAVLEIVELLILAHSQAIAIVGTFLELLKKNPIIDSIIQKTVKDQLAAHNDAMVEDLKKLTKIDGDMKASPADPIPLIAAGDFFAGWAADREKIALKITFDTLAKIVEALLRGNLGDVFVKPDIRLIANQLAQALEDIATSLVPTSARLEYNWSTKLSNDSTNTFRPGDPNDKETLKLKSVVYVDFLTGKRSVQTTGTLKAFSLMLIGSFELVQIFFEPLIFTSVDGAAPKFDVKIDRVEAQKELEFLKPLAAWMGGGDSGFYVKPSASGIEAGYVYNAGIIEVGELEFLNIALSVGCRLPFDDGPAQFFFRFASRDNPFLIAAPPYGGGGYVELLAGVAGITSLTVSFAFGGVAALEFGPLTAQARLVAGMAMQTGGGEFNLTGFVQAVGQGNIACFSICVFIEVSIQQHGSAVTGAQDYAFEFSVGFLSVKYEVHATYAVQGGGDKKEGSIGARRRFAALPSALGACDPATEAVYRTYAPRKAIEWHKYKKSLAMELLHG